MFKNISELEKAMRKILINLNKDLSLPDVEDPAMAYALYCCCEHGYIANLVTYQCASREYLFDKLGNMHITESGLRFIKETSLLTTFTRNIFSVFKGLPGFLLGIASTLITTFLAWHFGWIQ